MDKKEKIVIAALEAFQKNGIENTKISDIVKLAGVAQGTYYLYFPSKLSVMPAIAEKMVEKLKNTIESSVQTEAPFTKKLEQMVDAIFNIMRDYREVHALIYAGLASTEHIREWEMVYEPVYKWVNDLLNEAKEAQKVRNSIDLKHTSKIIIGLIESAAEQVYLYDINKENIAMKQKQEVLDFLHHALEVKE